MSHDTRLRETMKKVMKILKHEKVAGFVVLASPSHSEFQYNFPSWMVISIDGPELIFRSLKSMFDSKKLQQKVTEDSFHIILKIRDICALGCDQTGMVAEKLGQHYEIVNKPFHDF